MIWKRCLHQLGYYQPNINNKRLILSVLNSTATKREAKDYLKKYANNGVQNHCLILIRNIASHELITLNRFMQIVTRLKMLGIKPMFVMHPNEDVERQTDFLDNLFTKSQIPSICIPDALIKKTNGTYESPVHYRKLDGIIPIIKPYIFDESTCTHLPKTEPSTFMGLLVKHLDCHVDKFFLLNHSGGIPSGERNENAHVFINLSQEYGSLSKSLSTKIDLMAKEINDNSANLYDQMKIVFHKQELQRNHKQYHDHLEDLEIMNSVLSVLSLSSTGLITTLATASKLAKNPVLYNVLTDRSMISSSLPRFKRVANSDVSWYELAIDKRLPEDSSDGPLVTTVLKKGVDIKVFDYRVLTNENSIGLPIGFDNQEISMQKSCERVNLEKLKAIIDQSFNRKLDLVHYLNRINGRIASIIVIGDYEGLAILTYEGPTDAQFPYLDKFAVMPHLKGSLGISDIIFNLMFKKFPHELVWRSRRDNVVNKWYFQRSVGVIDLSMDIGEGNRKPSIFKLFFHGDPHDGSGFDNVKRLKEYAAYVRDIEPSWET